DELLADQLPDQNTGQKTDQAAPRSTTESLLTINQQIEICRNTLRGLTGLASDIAQPVAAITVNQYVDELLDTWQLLRPEINANTDITPAQQAVTARFHPVIRQALFNLFNNAADASPEQIQITISWSRDSLQIIIRDYGQGLTSAELETIGQLVPSNKPGGLGLGLYLTSSSLSRHGGQVLLANAEDGGLITTVHIELSETQP
ncbi:MAG: ATP-binding protein, partial [Immundisolibacteraceae bacterium]|nr:ATP-binding protein [Immundisolibacteraceae bacterium]